MKKSGMLSQRDLELLSAYLDGQLSRRQTRRLEARLEQEPALRIELDELRATVQHLHALPIPRASRHFTLRPEMVGERPQRRSYPVLRLATALAGLAFVALVGLEGLMATSGDQLASRAPEAMQQAEFAERDAPAEGELSAALTEPAATPALEALEVPAEEQAAPAMPAEEEAGELEEPMMMEEPMAAEGAATAEDQVQKASETPGAADAERMVEAEPSEGIGNVAGEIEQEDELAEPSVIGDAPEEAPPVSFAEEPVTPALGSLTPLRWLQVIAGALFILLSVLTITFRRQLN